MTDKQKYIIEVIESESEYRLEGSGLSAYNFIKKHMDIYKNYYNHQQMLYGLMRLSGLTAGLCDDEYEYFGDNPMDFKN